MRTWKQTLLLSLVLTLSICCISTLAAPIDTDGFVQCLFSYPHDPSSPISDAIYTRENSSSYSSVLQSYIRNLRFNSSLTPKPLLIVAAKHVSHVQASVLCGRTHGVLMRIRSGGHDYEGLSYVAHTPFFLLDMFNLRSIHVDVESETAWVQTGATLGEVFYRIFEKSKTHGFPAGVCPTVGVGGHVGGAGYGNLMRKYGLTVDNVLDMQMVDVNGRILDRSSPDGEDLFWAVSGGGGSSFGVVLAYKIRLVRVPETVTVFRVLRNVDDENATEIVDAWQHVAYALPDELFIRLVLDVVESRRWPTEKTVRATFIAMYLGRASSLVSVMQDKFPELRLEPSDCIETNWAKSVLFWSNFPVDTTPEDMLLDRRPQTLVYLTRKSDYVKTPIPKDGLESIWKKMTELEVPSMAFNPYGGEMARVPENARPFPHRAGILWKIQYLANWEDEDLTELNMKRIRELYAFMTPFVSKNPRQAFFNYRDLDLGANAHKNEKESYLEARKYGVNYFLGNFQRLVEIKSRVDPRNFFRNEQSVPVLPKAWDLEENRGGTPAGFSALDLCLSDGSNDTHLVGSLTQNTCQDMFYHESLGM